MAWPFSGNSGGNKNADQAMSEERLKILANVAIEQVPFPEQGMLSEEDAWTISPGPTRARINSQQSVPNVAASLAPAPAPVPAAPAPAPAPALALAPSPAPALLFGDYYLQKAVISTVNRG